MSDETYKRLAELELQLANARAAAFEEAAQIAEATPMFAGIHPAIRIAAEIRGRITENSPILDMQTALDAEREACAQIAENEPRVWDINAAPPQQRIAAAIRARKS